MVERVKEIATQLERMVLRDAKEFLQAKIPVPEARPVDAITGGISPLPRLGRLKRRRIKPLHAIHNIVRTGLPGKDRCTGYSVRPAALPAYDTGRNIERNREWAAGSIQGDA